MQKNNRIIGCFIFIVLCFSVHFHISIKSVNSPVIEAFHELVDLSPVFIESDSQINIDNDTDFVSLGCPGDGTPENPYRIENKSIIIDDFSPGIRVIATSKHFIIQNCYFEKLKRGIELSSVASNTSIIRNNVFQNVPLIGISIYGTNYTRIENNTGRNILEGIYTHNCYFSSIVNNSFVGCYNYEGMLDPSGMKIYRSYNGSIINNTITNFEQGIYTRDSSGFLIENNTCHYSRAEGSIYLYLSSDMDVKRNLVHYNLKGSGIMLMESDNCNITYNTIYHCALFGITIVGSNYNLIHHNNLLFNIITNQPQGFDNGINNIWYEALLEEGNYWSDWSGIDPYEIEASVPSYNYDIYPLTDLSGITIDDLYFPNTTNDDIYEENDYAFNNPTIALSITHNLHYADIDFFRINLQKSWKYSFLLEFNYSIINLDFYLLEEVFHEAEFNVFNGSYLTNNNEWFTFVAPDYGYYYLYVVGDLEHYKEIEPTDYQLTITAIALIPTTTSQTVGNIFLINWISVFSFILVTYYLRNNRKKRNSLFK